MITRAIKNCLRRAREKKWEKTYWAIDIHGTLLRPNFKKNEISLEFYPYAVEVMQKLATRKDIIKIMYTCSYPHEIKQYVEYFAQHGIEFDYINSNPEIINGSYGYYQDKFYFNVLMDDKAGFDGDKDWKKIMTLLENYNQ